MATTKQRIESHPPLQVDSKTASAQPIWRTVSAGLIGNVLEWYDFSVYGYLSGPIGAQFFPHEDPLVAQILVFATFAIGFVARPIGGLVLGRYGDLHGRRALLTLSILMMAGSTLLMAMIPNAATIGMAAPALMILLRIVQGFSLGGEFTGSIVYTTEMAKSGRRGLISSSTAFGTSLGFVLGSGAVALSTFAMGTETLHDWGWRVPILASVILAGFGWWVRRDVVDTAESKVSAERRPPLLGALWSDRIAMLRLFGIIAVSNAALYFTVTAQVEAAKARIPDKAALIQTLATVGLMVVACCKVGGGWLSDVMGRRRAAILATVMLLAALVPAHLAFVQGAPEMFFLGLVVMGIPLAMHLGIQGALVVEMFPVASRVMSMSLSYSITLAAVGGTAPLMYSWLVTDRKLAWAPEIWLAFLGVICLAVLIPMRDTTDRRLDV
ncbi:MAG: MFS transporter [Phycisphaerales bacterium]|nr:MFS transporter [Phycisphaerales bacterium]